MELKYIVKKHLSAIKLSAITIAKIGYKITSNLRFSITAMLLLPELFMLSSAFITLSNKALISISLGLPTLASVNTFNILFQIAFIPSPI